jgi:hypothetical protein
MKAMASAQAFQRFLILSHGPLPFRSMRFGTSMGRPEAGTYQHRARDPANMQRLAVRPGHVRSLPSNVNQNQHSFVAHAASALACAALGQPVLQTPAHPFQTARQARWQANTAGHKRPMQEFAGLLHLRKDVPIVAWGRGMVIVREMDETEYHTAATRILDSFMVNPSHRNLLTEKYWAA